MIYPGNLLSPSNLKRWRISSEACCNLCGKQICTTAHVLSTCKTMQNACKNTGQVHLPPR